MREFWELTTVLLEIEISDPEIDFFINCGNIQCLLDIMIWFLFLPLAISKV